MSAIKQWYSAAELAEMKLVGLPTSERRMTDRVKKDGYVSRQVPGKGGKSGLRTEYLPPKEILKQIQANTIANQANAVIDSLNQTDAVVVRTSSSLAVRDSFSLSDCNSAQLETHRAIANIVAFIQSFSGGLEAAIDYLNTEYSAGTLNNHLSWSYDHCLEKKRANSALNRTTYYNWLTRFKQNGHYAAKKREKDLSIKPWHAIAIALKQRPQGSNTSWIAEEIARQWSFNTAPPSYYTINRFFVHKFSQMDALKGRYTGSKLRSFKNYQHRTADGLAPADMVHGDGWNTHFTAPHPVTGEFVTYELWHFHDVATRYVPTPAIGLTENADVIWKGVENVIAELGVPLEFQTDSTKVVRGNDKFTKSVQSLEERLGFVWKHPKEVGNSQANGIAENFNVSYLDARSRELATYQNKKSMDDLTFKRVKKITADMVKAQSAGDLVLRDQKRLEATRMGKGLVFESYDHAVQWILQIIHEFNDRPHRSLKKVRDATTGRMRHQSPREALNEHKANGWEPHALDEQELIEAFRPHIIVKVTRETVSPYGGMRYQHPVLSHWNGKTVTVSYDVADYKKVWVKDMNGTLLCEAEFMYATGYSTPTAQEFATEKRTLATLRRIDNKRKSVIARTPEGILIEQKPSDGLTTFVFPDSKPEPVLVPFVFPDEEKVVALTMEDTRRLLREMEEKNNQENKQAAG